MTEPLYIYAIGFLAQLFFSLRILIQWIKSEKARKLVSPASYWIASLIGSYLFVFYGWLRHDFSIILGQFISYYIYIWNIREKGIWYKMGPILRTLLVLTPAVIMFLMLSDLRLFVRTFFCNEHIPLALLIFGSAGQVIFTLRFIYQWFYSVHRHESCLPIGFWIISLIGSGTIIAYGIFRADPVLILGQSFGFIAYTRNLVIGFKSRKSISNA